MTEQQILDRLGRIIELNETIIQMLEGGAVAQFKSMVESTEAPLTGADKIIQNILNLRPNLTREAVERLIEEERARAAGLLTEEAAAYLVASNLGIGESPPLAQSMQSLEQALASQGIDINLFEVAQNESTIKAKGWLVGNLWDITNNLLKTRGYNWVRDGDNSRWIKGGEPQKQRDFTIRDPDAPATEAQKGLLTRMKLTFSPDITKGDASKLISSKKNW